MNSTLAQHTSTRKFNQILEGSGITVNGSNTFDIRIKEGYEKILYERIIQNGSSGLGDSYVDGWWECDAIDEFFCRILSAGLDKKYRFTIGNVVDYIQSLFNQQNRHAAKANAQHHYNIGNDLYEVMLGQTGFYTCAYWKDAATLDDAQVNKVALINKKIHLVPGMSILDIGCGWGGYMKYTHLAYPEVKLHGITNSSEQVAEASKYGNVSHQDYRDMNGKYDRIVSIGMFEHVGPKNYRVFMETAHARLAKGGYFLLHTITGNASQNTGDPWLNKRIFPGSVIPSIAQIAKAAEGLFVIEDVHNFGPYYDHTLMAWYDNFVKGWPVLSGKYGEKFYRMWRYYLLCCAGSFRARKNQLSQIVLSKEPQAIYIPAR